MITFRNKIITSSTGKWLKKPEKPVDPYNPLGLPPNTVRVRTSDGNAPTKGNRTSYESATLVPGTTDVYDVYKSGTDFTAFLASSNNITEVLGANTTGITNMNSMFSACRYLVSIPLFDTSSVTDMANMFSNCGRMTTTPLFDTSNVTTMSSMFWYCYLITSVPLLDTSKVTNMARMFEYCIRAETGAFALYQQASTQANPPSSHSYCFRDCGSNTAAGRAELDQIPSGWK